jgi:plastocyanin
MTRAAAAALAAAVGVLAGCGGGTPPEPVATSRVELAKSYRFSPEGITVAAGTAVTWHNDDNFTHTVQVDGGETRKLAPGDTYSRHFAQRGTFDYVCTLHPGMNGQVTVR